MLLSLFLNLQFHVFESKAGARVVKTLEYSLDAAVAESVDFVLGLDNFPSTAARKTIISSARRASSEESGADTVSPSSINVSYNISNYIATNSGTTQAVASFLEYVSAILEARDGCSLKSNLCLFVCLFVCFVLFVCFQPAQPIL